MSSSGFVYGSYGLIVGALFRRELEGVLFIVLLAIIVAGPGQVKSRAPGGAGIAGADAGEGLVGKG